MANEITYSAILEFSKSGYSDKVGTPSQQATMTGTHFVHNKQTIPTGGAALALSSVATPGKCWVKNRDSTNFVTLRNGSGGDDTIKVKAGEEAMFRWDDGATPYAVADTASVELEYLLIED